MQEFTQGFVLTETLMGAYASARAGNGLQFKRPEAAPA